MGPTTDWHRTLAGSPPPAYTRLLALPAWVLLTQLFLALGWMRAAVAHGIDADWWRGVELQQFLAEHHTQALPGYVLFLDHVVEPAAAPVSVIVLAAEVGVAMALMADYRPMVALGVGMFLNVHFVAAGAVDPSIFYLIIGLGLLVWHQEHRLSPMESRRLARGLTFAAIGATLMLAPLVSTVAPAHIIEDPAVVLIFVAGLAALAFWSVVLQLDRRASASEAIWSLILDNEPEVEPGEEILGHPPPALFNASIVEPCQTRTVSTLESDQIPTTLGWGRGTEIVHDGSIRRGLPGLLR